MERYTADLTITVDLNVIAKYQAVTNAKVDRLKESDNSNQRSVNITVFAVKNDEGDDLHPAFDYWKYAEEIGLSESMANNLLYLFYLNCLYEWRVYGDSAEIDHLIPI